MKKFILNILKFTLFSFCIYLTLLLLWGLVMPHYLKPNLKYPLGNLGHSYSRFQEVKTTKDVDIIFLGSSHTFRSFDTRVFSKHGFKSFNLGSGYQTHIQTNYLLNRYLDQLNPKIAIYEVYPDIFMIDEFESTIDLIANDKIDIDTYQLVLEHNHIKVYNTLLYDLLRDFFQLDKNYTERKYKPEFNDLYIKGGFVEKVNYTYEKEEAKDIEIILDKKQLKFFNKNVQKLKDKGVKVILVVAPMPKYVYSRYSNFDSFDSLMNKQFDYYNFNGKLNLNDSIHFYDSSHLNPKGAGIFSNAIIDTLTKK